jgi:S1-C subfamily serine protease
VKIYNGSEKIAEIKESKWMKMDVGTVSSYELKFKSGTYFSNKSLSIDFSNKDVAFVKIYLSQSSWAVYEQDYNSAPIAVVNDYSSRINSKKLNSRIANHPKTDWTDSKFKKYFEGEAIEAIEGIYENSFKKENSYKYKVGVKLINGLYHIIYLSGSENSYWNEGDIKAVLQPTATKYFFKANWYMADKSKNEELFISFEKGLMNINWGDGKANLYIKLLPTSDSFGTEKTSGTGFAIASNGYIVTNYHVTEGANKISIRGINGDFSIGYSASVILEDKNNDLSIIKIDDSYSLDLGVIPFTIDNSISEVGSSVFALGYPLRATMGDEVKLTNGIISSRSGFKGDITTYQISVPVQPGNSGGPLFDDKGNIIGIINAKHAGAENASYAIKASYLMNLFNLMPTPPKLQKTSTLAGKPLTEQVKILKMFTYIIEIGQ